MLKPLYLACLLFLRVMFSQAQTEQQTRSDLKREKDSLEKQISSVKRALDDTHRNKKETLGQLALLQRKLHLRESVIQDINSQINFIQTDMGKSSSEILSLRMELDTLRAQFSKSVVFAYKNRGSYDLLNFIFSAISFSDAIERVAYLKSYRAYAEEKGEDIRRTQVLLQRKMDAFELSRREKDEILKRQNREKEAIEYEKREKDAVVIQLISREVELKQEIASKQRQGKKLFLAISAVIGRENSAARLSRKKASSVSGTAPLLLVPATGNAERNMRLTGSFEKHRGKLPWPVSNGRISMHFGLQEYLPRLKHFNIGITLDVRPGSLVKAVYEGRVESVLLLGDVSALVIRHGKYFTTYSNLSTVSVSENEQVKTGQIIGEVAEIGKLEFAVSDDKVNWIDPEKWLQP